MRISVVSMVSAALLLVAPAAYANNLLVNGSFENTTGFVGDGNDTMQLNVGSTTMAGWTVVSNQLAWIGPTNPYGLTASDGSYFLDLTSYGDSGPYGGVQQNIATVAGGSYLLSFDLGGSTTYGATDSIMACAGIGNCQTFSITATTTNEWISETLNFTGTGHLMDISLVGMSGGAYIGLDNVAVSGPVAAVPEPGTLALLGSGLLAAAGAVRRRKNARRA